MSLVESIKRIDTAWIGLIIGEYILQVVQTALFETNLVIGLHSCFCMNKHLLLKIEQIAEKTFLSSYCSSCDITIYSNEIPNGKVDAQK